MAVSVCAFRGRDPETRGNGVCVMRSEHHVGRSV